MVEVVDAVDEAGVEVCGGEMDEADLEIGDNCSLSKARGCFCDSDLIAAVADWVGGGGKKVAGMSWIRHTSDKVLTA